MCDFAYHRVTCALLLTVSSLLMMLGSAATVARTVNTGHYSSDDPLHSVPVRVAQCRAQCLDKFTWTGWSPSDTLCQEQPDCFMCWESCDLLNQNFVVWGAMCDRKDICFPGCQQACNFYVHGSIADKSSALPVFRLKFTRPIDFGVRESTNSLTLSWSKPEIYPTGSASSKSGNHENNVVYVIVRRTRDNVGGSGITKWQQVAQTSEMSSAVDAGSLPPAAIVDFKVIAVTGGGMAGQLVTSYHVADGVTMPQDANKAAAAAAAVSSAGRQEQVERGALGDVSTVRQRNWRLHLMALNQNRRLGSVDAVVTWASPGLTGNFLVTWEVKEGTFAITGHLYTDSTTVSLTLWPHTIYSVQVELVSETLDKAARSEPLTIDTNVRRQDEDGDGHLLNTSGVCDDTIVVAGVAVAVVVILVLVVGVLLLLLRRCRRDDAKMMSPASTTVQFNNNGLTRAGAVRRKLSTIAIGDPVDVEAVLSPRPYCAPNSPKTPSSADLSSSLDERLSAFRAFLDNVEKMASTSPKPCNQTTAFTLPSSGETKASNCGGSSNMNRFHRCSEREAAPEDDVSSAVFEATPATEMLIKKSAARRCMSTAM